MHICKAIDVPDWKAIGRHDNKQTEEIGNKKYVWKARANAVEKIIRVCDEAIKRIQNSTVEPARLISNFF